MEFRSFDEAYLERLRAGDNPTERHFAGYFGQIIEIYLRSKIREPDKREDIRQETFLRFFRIMGSDAGVRQPERLGPLVLSICRNVTYENIRPRPTESIEGIPEPQDPAADPFEEWIRKRTRVGFQEILRELPERDRRLLQQVYWEERDKDEICKSEGINRNYLRGLLLRARVAFKREYLRQTGQKPRQREGV
jgi:RNA polymerase sigma-70 factor (ECF subfamily)